MDFRRLTDGVLSKPAIVSVVSILALWFGATAGSLTPSGAPASTMNTLAEIYDSIVGAFDSSSVISDQDGSLIQNLKYIENNIVWASASPDIYTLNSGNVGIGTSTPNNKLQVAGLISFDDSNANTALGSQALQGNTTGFANTAVGGQALFTNSSSVRNTAVGYQALYSTSTGFGGNTAVGYLAMQDNTTGYDNTAVGREVLANNTTGDTNVAIGQQAMYSNTTGFSNTALGAVALSANSSGYYNTAIGAAALWTNSTGYYNSALGNSSLFWNSTGTYNSAFGPEALYLNTTGSNNEAFGYRALYSNMIGNHNTAIGDSAGINALGTGNIFLGYNAGYQEHGSNTLWIDNQSTASSSAFLYGELDNDYLRIGASTELIGTASISGVLYVNGGCVGCGGVSSDSLDFDEFVDAMTLDAGTTIASGGFGLTLHPNIGIGGSPTSLAKLIVDAGAGQYPIGIIVSASNHGTSQRATLQLGDQWQLLQDKLGNGTEDFGIWNANNSGYAMAITTTGSVSIGWAGNYSQSKLQVIGNQTIGADWYNIVAPANGLVVEGNVGIGSTAPTYKLEIGTPGDVNIASTGAALYIGGVRMLSGKSPFGATVWVGPNAGINNTSGYLNTAVGADAMRSNNGGYRNTAVGYAAMYSNYNGFMNTAVGDEALYTNSDGAGSGNSALGMQSLYSNNGGFHNTAMGQYAAYANVLGAHIAAFGWEALYNNTSSYNNAMGAQALLSNTSGTYNNAFGYRALYSNTTGSHNTALGEQALFTGTMSDATAVGYLAGYYSSSSNNVFIGSGADVEGVYLSELVTNAIALGTNAKVAASRQLVVGADNGTNYLSEGYFGSGVSASAPSAFRFHASGGRGSNIAGASLTLAGGISTGTAAGGSLLFQTSSAGSAGSAANALTTRLTIDSTGLANFAGSASVSGNFELSGFVSSNLTPTVTDTYDLGTSALRWRDLYLASASLHIGTSGNEAVIGYNTTGTQGLTFKPDGSTTALFVGDSGNVGIGSSSPGSLLALAGGNVTQRFATNPTQLSVVTTATQPSGIDISGTVAYVAHLGGGGVKIYDIYNPASPSLISTIATPGTGASWLQIVGKLLYVADSDALRIYDVTSLTNPVLVGSVATTASIYVTVNGGYAYVSDYGAGVLRVIDVRNPARPQIVFTSNFLSASPYQLFVQGNLLFAGRNNFGWQIWDISNPESPTFLSAGDPGQNRGVYATGHYFFTGGDFGFDIYDISNPASTSHVYSDTGQDVYRLSGAGNYLYIATGLNTIDIYDIRNPRAPIKVSTFSGVSTSGYVKVVGRYGYVADYAGQFRVIDMNGIESPTLSTGALSAGILSVQDGATVGSLLVRSGLNIGSLGFLSEGQGAIDVRSSASAFTVTQRGLGNLLSLGSSTSQVFYVQASSSGNVNLTLKSPWASGNDGKFTLRSSGASERLDILNGANTSLMTIASSGNVGIGVTNPETKIEFSGIASGTSFFANGGGVFAAYNDAHTGLYVDVGNTGASLRPNEGMIYSEHNLNLLSDGNTGGGAILFHTFGAGGFATSLKMELTSAGNLGIGPTTAHEGAITPDQKLDVAGNILASTSGNVDLILNSTTSDDTKFTIRSVGVSDRLDILGSASQQYLSILKGGNIGIGTTNIDTKLEVAGGSASVSGSVSVGGNLELRTPNQSLVSGVQSIGFNQINTVSLTPASGFVMQFQNNYLLMGGASATPGVYGIMGQFGQGTDLTGGDLSIEGGYGTGTGAGGRLLFRTAPAGSVSGSSNNAELNRMAILSNGNVGINTLTPSSRMQVVGSAGNYDIFDIASSSGTSALHVAKGGNIGIGTTTPSTTLDVSGSASISSNFEIDGTASISNAFFAGIISTAPTRSGIFAGFDGGSHGIELTTSGGTPYVDFQNQTSIDFDFRLISNPNVFSMISSASGAIFNVAGSGNVGIANTSPGAKLDITTAGSTTGLRIIQPNANSYAMMINNTTYGSGDANGFGLWQGNLGGGMFDVGGATQMSITTTGNVGIGTIGPGTKLEVVGNILASASGNVDFTIKSGNLADAEYTFRTGSNATFSLLASSGAQIISIASNGNFTLLRPQDDGNNGAALVLNDHDSNGYVTMDNSQDRFRLYSDLGTMLSVSKGGRMTVGQDNFNPPAILFVDASGSYSSFLIYASASNDGNIFRLKDSDGTCDHNPESGAETVTCSSDRRLKTDISDADSVLAFLNDFRIRTYTVKASGDRMTGVIAQELLQSHPEMVSSSSDGLLTVQQPNPWVLLKGIQELDAKIAALQTGFGAVASGTGPFTFDDATLTMVFDAIVERLASVLGIELTQGSVKADTVESQRLCVGSVCVTQEQFLQMVENSGAAVPEPSQTPEATAEPTPEITPVPTPENGSSDEPLAELSPEPTPVEPPAEEPITAPVVEPTP